MMSASAFARRAGVAALVLALLGAFGWVLFRTGPLAPEPIEASVFLPKLTTTTPAVTPAVLGGPTFA